MPLRGGVAAKEAEHEVAEGAPRAPRLLPAQTKPAACIVTHRRALDGGEIATRVGFRPPLGPQIVARRHARQDAILLLFGAEFEERRCEQENPVLCDALRAAGAVVLFLENEPLHQRGLASAVFLGPRDDRPP